MFDIINLGDNKTIGLHSLRSDANTCFLFVTLSGLIIIKKLNTNEILLSQ